MNKICEKCGRKDIKVNLCNPRKYSKLKTANIDACIAPLVQMLNDFGVRTLNSCCGHVEYDGEIIYEQEGEKLILKVQKPKGLRL